MTQTARIRVDLIDRNPDQPRRKFCEDKLAALAASIIENGLHQPITVRPVGDRFQIVMGERRWRAHKLAGLVTIEAQIKPMTLRQRDVAAIVENLQREDVTPLEESDALQRLASDGMTRAEIAKATGLALFRVEWRLRLQNLAPPVRTLLEGEQIDRQTALEVARLDDHAEQVRIVRLVSVGQLRGWKAVRNAVTALLEGEAQGSMFGEAAPAVSKEEAADLTRLERRIERVGAMIADGFRDGECVTACRVSRDRAALMADRLAAMRLALASMERDLRNTLGQAALAA